MRKKIGCVIAYRKNHTNYGTSLVGYSLIKTLQQMGCDVEIINYVKRPSFKEKVEIAINQFRVQGLKTFLKRFKPKPNNMNYIHGIQSRTLSVEEYKERKLLPLFHNYVGYKELCEGSKNYDVVVVGSDQVWLPHGLKTKFFNLLFVDESVRKVSYASSFGVSKIPKFQIKETANYLNRFYAISVREQRGKEIVEEISNKYAMVVADPTLLLNSAEWLKEAKESKVNYKEPYIFCYLLGSNPDSRRAANELKQKTGLKIVALRHMDEFVPEDEQFGDFAPYDINPNDFVKLISDAAYVCTDSFHCTAFSVQFHKKFMTFYRFSSKERTSRNSRIDSLFNVLDIPKEHIYIGDISLIENEVNWGKVDENLASLRKKSMSYLENTI